MHQYALFQLTTLTLEGHCSVLAWFYEDLLILAKVLKPRCAMFCKTIWFVSSVPVLLLQKCLYKHENCVIIAVLIVSAQFTMDGSFLSYVFRTFLHFRNAQKAIKCLLECQPHIMNSWPEIRSNSFNGCLAWPAAINWLHWGVCRVRKTSV